MFTKQMALAVMVCLAKFTGCYLVSFLAWALVWIMLIRRPRRGDSSELPRSERAGAAFAL